MCQRQLRPSAGYVSDGPAEYDFISFSLCCSFFRILAFFSGTLPLMYAAAALYGVGFGLFNPGMALLVADRSRMVDEVPRMLSLHIAMNGFGQFFTVYILKGVRTLLGYNSVGYDWLGAGVLIVVL